jgi:hypothetical protein
VLALGPLPYAVVQIAATYAYKARTESQGHAVPGRWWRQARDKPFAVIMRAQKFLLTCPVLRDAVVNPKGGALVAPVRGALSRRALEERVLRRAAQQEEEEAQRGLDGGGAHGGGAGPVAAGRLADHWPEGARPHHDCIEGFLEAVERDTLEMLVRRGLLKSGGGKEKKDEVVGLARGVARTLGLEALNEAATMLQPARGGGRDRALRMLEDARQLLAEGARLASARALEAEGAAAGPMPRARARAGERERDLERARQNRYEANECLVGAMRVGLAMSWAWNPPLPPPAAVAALLPPPPPEKTAADRWWDLLGFICIEGVLVVVGKAQEEKEKKKREAEGTGGGGASSSRAGR